MSTDNREVLPASENEAGEVKPTPAVKPTIGRVIYYKLSAQDAESINKRRADAGRNRDKMKVDSIGYQAHVGNSVSAGQIVSGSVVAVWESQMINAKLDLDGNDSYWVTSVSQGEEEGNWDWMPFQKDQQARLAKEE
jgi:hypothetical protein